MTITHHALGPEHLGLTPRIPAEDTFVAALYLTDVPYHELWHGNRPRITQGYARSSLRIVHLGDDCSARITDPHEALAFYIPRALLDGFAEQADTKAIGHLACPPGLLDRTLGHLAGALLPALAEPDRVTPLFIDHVGFAVLAHLTERYGGGVQRTGCKGGLSRSAVRSIEEHLAARADARPTLAEFATEAGLSRGYLVTAFRRATGLTPYRWLQRHRIEMAKELLGRSRVPITEIASRCGFVDQSHLTRAFSTHVGVTPGEWRRAKRF